MTLPCRYGFNPGSQLVLVGLQNSLAVSNCAVTTTLAPAAAGLSSLLVKAIISHRSTGALSLTCLCMPVELPWWQGVKALIATAVCLRITILGGCLPWAIGGIPTYGLTPST